MSRNGSAANAGIETGNRTKDIDEQQHGGPLHFSKGAELFESEAEKSTLVGARAAANKERSMTLMQGVRLYPKAVFWSMLISTCIVMEGYDVCLINNFYGFPAFQKKYGEQLADGTWEIPAPWQSGLTNGVQCGQISEYAHE